MAEDYLSAKEGDVNNQRKMTRVGGSSRPNDVCLGDGPRDA